MKSYKHITPTLPTIFHGLEYFAVPYLKRAAEVVNKTLQVGWQQLKILHSDSQFQWRAPKSGKLICRLNANYQLIPVAYNGYIVSRRKVPNFRYIFNLPVADGLCQLQVLYYYKDYHANTRTEIRHYTAKVFAQNYSHLTITQLLTTGIRTDYEQATNSLKGLYPALRTILITKCRIV